MWTFALAVVVTVACAVAADRWIAARAASFVTHDMDRLGTADVALVLGTAPRVWQGRPNQFFERRMDAAAALWKAGKVRWLLVSGDNRARDYDEPTAMRAALIARGVPAQAIYRDSAGVRTLDSVLRASDVFGQKHYIVVSQRFHNERAVVLARLRGIEAWGYDAAEVDGALRLVPRLREYVARLRALYDMVAGTRPRHGGPPVVIGQDPPT